MPPVWSIIILVITVTGLLGWYGYVFYNWLEKREPKKKGMDADHDTPDRPQD